jgi:hypothetical protein
MGSDYFTPFFYAPADGSERSFLNFEWVQGELKIQLAENQIQAVKEAT